MEIGAVSLIISHLFLFWFWTVNYSENQVKSISLDCNSSSKYCQLLIYYLIEHSCIILVFLSAAKIYYDDLCDFHRFEFFKANKDSALMQALDEYVIPDQTDKLIETYYKLLFIYLNQLITNKTLKSCVKDEWLQTILCKFVAGDKDINIFYDKEILQLLSEDKIENDHNDDLLILLDQDDDDKISVSQFGKLFDKQVKKITESIQKKIDDQNIKQLVNDYVNYCVNCYKK